MNSWLRQVRSAASIRQVWRQYWAKLQGHLQLLRRKRQFEDDIEVWICQPPDTEEVAESSRARQALYVETNERVLYILPVSPSANSA